MLLKDFFQSRIFSGCSKVVLTSDKWDSDVTFSWDGKYPLDGKYPSVWLVSTAPVLSHNFDGTTLYLKIGQ